MMLVFGGGTWCAACLFFLFAFSERAQAGNAVGVRGEVGCSQNPQRVRRLEITKPGVYENYLVDSDWADGNRVKITADNVTLRNSEIRNATVHVVSSRSATA